MQHRSLALTAGVLVLELLCSLDLVVCSQTAGNGEDTQISFGFSLNSIGKPGKKQSSSKTTTAQDNDDVLRVSTTLVVNEVLVRSPGGTVVTGLSQGDFLLTEDSRPETIEVFAPSVESKIPRSIILILDYSESELPYIETSIEAAKTLVDKLNPTDRMAIVTDDVELLTNFTTDKQVLKERLDSLKARALSGKFGKSQQYYALLASLNELFPEGTLRPIVIFQTDGDQLLNMVGYSGSDADERAETAYKHSATLRALRTRLEEIGATVYTIVPGTSYLVDSHSELIKIAKTEALNARDLHARINNTPVDTHEIKKSALEQWANRRRRNELSLKYLSESAGGIIEYLVSPSDAGGVYDRILTNMNQRYVIGYYSTNQNHDGKRRKIALSVRRHSELEIIGKKSYFASKQ